jgi:hypothetical protein
VFELAASDLFQGKMLGPTFAGLHTSPEENPFRLLLVPVIKQELASRNAIAVDEYEMLAAGSADSVVQHDILPPPFVFMPEVSEGVGVFSLGLYDDIADRGSRTVVGDNDLKICKGLPGTCCEDKPKILRLVVEGYNQRE